MDLEITDAIEVEDACGLFIEVVSDDEIVFGTYIISFDVTVADGTSIVGR